MAEVLPTPHTSESLQLNSTGHLEQRLRLDDLHASLIAAPVPRYIEKSHAASTAWFAVQKIGLVVQFCDCMQKQRCEEATLTSRM